MEMQFEGQYDDEKVLFIFRHHVIKMRIGFYFLLVPFLLGSLPVLLWPTNLDLLWWAFVGLLLGVILFFYQWIGWYFSVFIVTDQRIRQVAHKGLFNKTVIDLGLSKIQNISYNVPGFSAAMFGFGTVVVQTYVGDMYLEKIEHPAKIYERLAKAVKEYGGGAPEEANNEELD